MKLKKYKRKTISNYLLLEIIIIILSIVFSFFFIGRVFYKYNDLFLSLAEAKIRKYMTEIINDATKSVVFSDSLFMIERNNSNQIELITYNSGEATKLTNKITDNIQDKLYNSIDDSHDNIYLVSEIPMGVIFRNGILRNIGPRIKVRMEMIGNIISELETEVKPYGINNALIEVRVNIKANAKIVLPVTTKDIVINNNIPISINVISGSVPEAYLLGYK